jgi:uncharacterized protein (TIGR04376 family)
MGLLDDLNQFLEMRLEEFLQSNPHLELLALEESLNDQEAEVNRLLVDLKAQLQQIQADIRATAQEVQRWHLRVDKARSANRPDLVEKAQEREATLLHQGNQQWSRMRLLQERIQQSQTLLQQTQARRQEVRAKAAEMKTAQVKADPQSSQQGWSAAPPKGADPLEAAFSRWEADLELEDLKRNMNR